MVVCVEAMVAPLVVVWAFRWPPITTRRWRAGFRLSAFRKVWPAGHARRPASSVGGVRSPRGLDLGAVALPQIEVHQVLGPRIRAAPGQSGSGQGQHDRAVQVEEPLRGRFVLVEVAAGGQLGVVLLDPGEPTCDV